MEAVIDSPPLPSAFDRYVSWFALGLLTLAASAFAWYVPQNRAAFLRVFGDFRIELPRSVATICSVPSGVIIALAPIAIAAALLVQLRARSHRSATMFHLLLTATFAVIFLMYREAMGSVMTNLMQQISR